MKKILASAAALSLLASAASAGSLVEADTEPMVEAIQEDDDDGSGILLPLVALLAIGALVASGSSSGTSAAP